MDRLKFIFFLALVVLLLVLGGRYSPTNSPSNQPPRQAAVPPPPLSADVLRTIKVTDDEHAAVMRGLTERADRFERELRIDRERSAEVMAAIVARVDSLAVNGAGHTQQTSPTTPAQMDAAMELIRGIINAQQEQKALLDKLAAEVEGLKQQSKGLDSGSAQSK